MNFPILSYILRIGQIFNQTICQLRIEIMHYVTFVQLQNSKLVRFWYIDFFEPLLNFVFIRNIK